MSIYGTIFSVGEWPDGLDEGTSPGVVRTREEQGPWRGSNVYPTDTTGCPASIGLAHIPPWCVPGHEGEEVDGWGDRLRLDVSSERHHDDAVIILDETAARNLATALLAWADGITHHPEEAP